ncbi:MAG TPA: sensor N-terminal transmembrane domain-containing protein, partial [Alphaproteobacteria bacterium]|nr:sensor N-terminal transmembrane domain-containing protein [Alphaproteobacteria bacterium]
MAILQHFPKKPKPRLSQRILLINLITLLIPLIGILQTNNYRQTLINRELAVLETDAHIFATAL